MLSGDLDADLFEIRCERYRPGLLRYLRAGYDSLKGNLPPIDLPPVVPAAFDLVLLGMPIWTSHPALPMRSFLAGAPRLPARVGIFLTYGEHSPAATAIAELEESLGRRAAATLALKGDELADARGAGAVRAFVDELTRGVA